MLGLYWEWPSDIHHSVLEDFLLNSSLSWFNLVTLEDFSNFNVRSTFKWACQRLARRVMAFSGICSVWVAVLSEYSDIFSEESIENWPPSSATLIHVIAWDELLYWEIRYDSDTVLHSESVLYDLDERVGAWRHTSLLVSNLTSVVDAVNIS